MCDFTYIQHIFPKLIPHHILTWKPQQQPVQQQ